MAHWRRILYVSFVAQTLSLIGFSFVFPFLPLYIQTLGVRGRAVPVWSGVLSFGLSLAMALVAPVWGTLADRYGRKPMVVRAMAGGVLTTGLLIVAPNVWVVLLLRILQGILAGSVAASQALVAAVTPREEMAFSMGLMQAAVFSGAAVGPLIGGFLDDRLGFHGTFAAGAAMLLVAALLVVFFVDERFERPAGAGSARINPYANMRGLVASAGLLAMALVLFMAEFGNVVPAPVLPLFVPHLSGVPRVGGQPQTSTAVGLILAVAGVCAALSSWRVQRLSDRFGYRRVLIAATALAGALYVPAFFVQSVWQLVAVRAIVGFCLGAAMPTASAMVGLLTPERRRASAYSLMASATSLGIAVGPLVGGALGALYGLRPVFLTTASVLILVALVVAMTVREPALEPAEEPVVAATRSVTRRLTSGARGGRR
jgi:DHA1 family multidrug resistance protein-like MFS transporter